MHDRIDSISLWHIQKTVDSGHNITYYALVDGSGNTIGDTIDVTEEQYLENVEYISAATEQDHEIDEKVVIGEPYLKFTWKYGIITYVAIKDWVNDYFAGDGIEINNEHEISVKLSDEEKKAAFIKAFQLNAGTDIYYRILAAKELDIQIDELEKNIFNPSSVETASNDADAETLLRGYADFGFEDLIYPE